MNKFRKRYEIVCNEYLKEFCNKYEFEYAPDFWVANKVVTIIQIADYFFL